MSYSQSEADLLKQLADAQATVEALQRERDGLEQNCLNNHVTIEQADAKVMKLEGERGMWATERIDLLTQLENAEFALDAERDRLLLRVKDLEKQVERLEDVALHAEEDF